VLGVGDDVVGIKREDAVGPDPRGERQDVVSSMSQFGTKRSSRCCRRKSAMRDERTKLCCGPRAEIRISLRDQSRSFRHSGWKIVKV
jgi:hypothetical protein